MRLVMNQPLLLRPLLVAAAIVATALAVPLRGANGRHGVPEDALRDALAAALAGLYTPCPHEGTRRLEGSAPGRSGWLEVATSYQAGQGFTYRVLAQGGNESVRRRALLKVLETEARATTHVPASERPTVGDYRLGQPSSTDEALRVPLTPLRSSPGLVSGTFLVSPEGVPLAIEGRLARSPSFWVKSVVARWTFANVAGIGVLPVRVDSVADIRFVGVSQFSMTYSYKTVAGLAATQAATGVSRTATSQDLQGLQAGAMRNEE
jgi:hypothetical protein